MLQEISVLFPLFGVPFVAPVTISYPRSGSNHDILDGNCAEFNILVDLPVYIRGVHTETIPDYVLENPDHSITASVISFYSSM